MSVHEPEIDEIAHGATDAPEYGEWGRACGGRKIEKVLGRGGEGFDDFLSQIAVMKLDTGQWATGYKGQGSM